MSKLIIKTNNVPREWFYAFELSNKDLAELGYDEDLTEEESTKQFVKYRGILYDMNDFITTYPGPWNHGLPEEFRQWDGYSSDSFFSGVLLKYVKDNERVVMATYYS